MRTARTCPFVAASGQARSADGAAADLPGVHHAPGLDRAAQPSRHHQRHRDPGPAPPARRTPTTHPASANNGDRPALIAMLTQLLPVRRRRGLLVTPACGGPKLGSRRLTCCFDSAEVDQYAPSVQPRECPTNGSAAEEVVPAGQLSMRAAPLVGPPRKDLTHRTPAVLRPARPAGRRASRWRGHSTLRSGSTE